MLAEFLPAVPPPDRRRGRSLLPVLRSAPHRQARWAMPWWIWVLAGLGLLIAEVASPGGFFAVFFGVAAILVGVVKALAGPGAGPGGGGALLGPLPSPRRP